MAHIHRPGLRRCLVAAAAALAGSGVLGAAAQVITDPTNSVEVATGGDPSSAYLLAVSDGGTASGTGAAVAVGTGQASSQNVALSTGGQAYACGGHFPVAVSPLGAAALSCQGSQVSDPSGLGLWGVGAGCSSGAYLAAGDGCASSSNGVATGVSGDASGRVSATTVAGNATAGSIAITDTGTAYACGGVNPVAFSAQGSSSTCRGTLPVGAHEGGLSVNGD